MILAFYSIILALAMQTAPLQSYQWKNRIIVIASDQRLDLEKQVSIFKDTKEGFADRDLMLVTLYQNHLQIDGNTPNDINLSQIRTYYNLPSQGFRILLIGKDGSIKLSEDSIVDHKRIYHLIDSMPMRKAEMRREKGSY